MKIFTRRGRRWVVPAGVLAAVLGVGAVANLVPAHADTPNLPALTPAELLAKVRTAQPPSLSGTITLTSNLGLPSTSALSSSLGGSSTTTLDMLLAGSHSADVWMDGPDHLRLSTAKPLTETNWIRNGSDLWSYDSSTNTARHATLKGDGTSGVAEPSDPQAAPTPEQTPAAFAQQLLDQVTPSTDVRVDTPRYIDNRPVYELVLSPKTTASTIKDAVVSVDAATGVPLAVRIDATSGSNPAFSVGFTSVDFNKPASSRFTFSPPPGSTVVQAASPADLLNPAPTDGEHHRRAFAGRKTPGAADQFPAPNELAPATSSPDAPSAPSEVKTVGTDWSTVAIVAAGSVPSQLDPLFAQAPSIAVGNQQGKVVTTKLVNAILLPDGRVALGALAPDALAAAAAAG